MEFVLLVVVGAASWFVRVYNCLRTLSDHLRGARSNILAATRKCFDLAQRIADLARSYADHEKLVRFYAGEAISDFRES